MIVKNAGNPSEKSLKSIELIFDTIKPPTIISAGAVAQAGIRSPRGVIKNPKRNNRPTNTAVKPVLPPALIPVADST